MVPYEKYTLPDGFLHIVDVGGGMATAEQSAWIGVRKWFPIQVG